MSASERFMKTIDRLRISAYDLEKNYGIKNAQAKVSQYRKGVISKISLEIISAACEANPNLDAEYILTGRRKVSTESDTSKYKELKDWADSVSDEKRMMLMNAIHNFIKEHKGSDIENIVIMDADEFKRTQEMYNEAISLLNKALSENERIKSGQRITRKWNVG